MTGKHVFSFCDGFPRIYDMETILGLLLFLLPFVFKAVEKKLQASGKPAKKAGNSGLPEESAEYDVLTEDDADIPSEVYAALQEADVPEIQDIPVRQEVPVAEECIPCRPAAVSHKRGAAGGASAESQRGNRIDPKKLILYSEIMKPKYDE